MLDTETKPQPLRILEQLFSMATRDATAAMCLWTGGQVSLSFEELREVDIAEACSVLGVEDQRANDGRLGGRARIRRTNPPGL